MTHQSLAGQSIIVTGASSGIGKAAATLLAQRGVKVVPALVWSVAAFRPERPA